MMTVDEFHNYLSMMWYQYGCADKDQITKIIEEELSRADDYKDGDHLKRAVLRRCQSETLIDEAQIAELMEENKKLNQEVLSCHDTLLTIEALCDAILNYDFKDTNSKSDFCHMLNEMDNKDLAFLKETFTAIRDNDLKTMTSLTMECLMEEGVLE